MKLADKIHINPGIQLQEGPLMGVLVDKSPKPAKTVLALMVPPPMQQPALFARLMPIFSLKFDFIFDQIIQSMKITYDTTGIVDLVTCGNLKYMFIKFYKKCDSARIYAVQHPMANEEYKNSPYYKTLFTSSKIIGVLNKHSD